MSRDPQEEDATPPTGSLAELALETPALRSPAAPSAASLDPGGRYHRVATLGEGGMARVYRVHDRHLNRMVAMKVLAPARAREPAERARFVAEAALLAKLQHPGVVQLHDRGFTIDGRPWFTMQEVRGVTLHDELRRVHAGEVDEHTTAELMRSFLRICETVAFAHDLNIIHADLKPANLMLGEHGQVLVLDWGLARSPTSESSSGQVSGTAAFLPPELLASPPPEPSPLRDVYALGAVLYNILAGHAPFTGSANSILGQLRNGPPPALTSLPPSPLRHIKLCELCAHAMERQPERRPQHASVIADAVRDWLDGRRRHAAALAVVARADAMAPELEQLMGSARELEQQAAALMENVSPFDPIEKKLPAWALQEKAEAVRQRIAVGEARWVQVLRSALNEVPSFALAHERLAAHYRAKMEASEMARQFADAAHHEAMLRDHDRGEHAAYLRGDGRLSLLTEPAGATVELYRYVNKERRLEAEHVRSLEATPLYKVVLARGSYLLEITHPQCHTVRYPVVIDRGEHWNGVRPGGERSQRVMLPKAGTLADGEIYVPAGWFISGGDPRAGESLPRRRLWADAFIMQRDPVTNAQFATFLNALCLNGEAELAETYAPSFGFAGAQSSDGEFRFLRDDKGLFTPQTSGPLGDMREWPVARINRAAAMAYARWYSKRTGRQWQLPNELQWEKAARGADGRFAPWGDHLDPSRANMQRSYEDALHRRPIGIPASDVSPYGVRGMGGNTRDWCCNLWLPDGPPLEDNTIVTLAHCADPGEELLAVRGGAWCDPEALCRSASRFAARVDERFRGVGFRLISLV